MLSTVRLIAAALQLQAATSDPAVVRLERRGPEVIAVRPGGRVTVGFRVVNGSVGTVSLREAVTVPDGWQYLPTPPSFDVPRDGAELRLVSVQSPRNGPAGTHWLVYQVLDGETSVARDSVRIAMEEYHSAEIQFLDGPSVAPTDRPYSARFLVLNASNTALSLQVKATGPLAGASRLDSASWRAAPQASRVLTLTLNANAVHSLRGPYDIGVNLTATEDSTIYGTAHVVVEFVPRSTSLQSDAPRLPVSLMVRIIPRRDGRIRGVGELTTSGPVSPDGRTTLDLSLRSRGISSNPLFDQDDYRLLVQGPQWRVRAGDQYFVQSPLTEAGVLAFGAAGELGTSRFRAQLFELGSRWDFRSGVSRGGSLAYRLFDSTTVAVNALSQRGDDAGQVMSLGITGSPLARSRVRLEVGGGRSATERLARGVGWQLAHQRPLFEVEWTGHRTGDGYPARHGRGDEDALFSALGPADGVRLRYAHSARSVDLSPYRVNYEYRGREQSIGLQLTSAATLEWRSVSTVSHAEHASVDEQSHSARGMVFRRLGPIELTGIGETGTVLEHATDRRRPFSQVSLHSTARWSSSAWISFFVDRNDRRSVAGYAADRWTSSGADASARLGRTSLSVMVLNVRDALFSRIRSALFDARIDRWFGGASRVSVRARTTSFGAFTSGQERYVALEFATTLRVPSLPDRHSGRVEARVFDPLTGRGIADALIALGNRRFLTDANGRLEVGALAPGTYALRVDEESVGGRVEAGGTTPRVVRVDPRRTASVAIGLEPGAAVSGRVVQVRGADSTQTALRRGTGVTVSDSGLPNVLITLSGGDRTLRQLTDSQGKFTFAGLAPGRWKVTVDERDLPALHRPDPREAAVELTPGAVAKVEFRVAPVQRGLRWIGGGELSPPPKRPPHD